MSCQTFNGEWVYFFFQFFKDFIPLSSSLYCLLVQEKCNLYYCSLVWNVLLYSGNFQNFLLILVLCEFLYTMPRSVFYPTKYIFTLLKVCSTSWTCKFISLTKLESFDLLLQIFFYLFSPLTFLDSNDMLDDLILSYKSRIIYFSSIFSLCSSDWIAIELCSSY